MQINPRRRLSIASLALLCSALPCSTLLCACSSSPTGGPFPDSGAPPPVVDGAPIPQPGRMFNGPLFLRRAEANELSDFARDEIDVAPNGELVLPSGGGKPGQDPHPPGSYNGGNYYNGGSYRSGVARSTEWVSATPFDQVIPSFEAVTPPGTWVTISLSARVGGRWTKDYVMGAWASSTETIKRHSVAGQDDGDAAVKTDTLALEGAADALRLTIELFSEHAASPRVRSVAATVSRKGAAPPADGPTPAARGKVLDVPQRSQMLYQSGGNLCSPTSTTMLLAYWSNMLGRPQLTATVPETEALVFDHGANIRGNWTFNMAHAASVDGGVLHAVVTRLASLHQIERLIAAEVPVAISVKSTQGHLLVVRGFTAEGDVVCNDPAFPSDAEVRVTYKRAELSERWLSHSQGTTYVVWPVGKALPVDPLGAY